MASSSFFIFLFFFIFLVFLPLLPTPPWHSGVVCRTTTPCRVPSVHGGSCVGGSRFACDRRLAVSARCDVRGRCGTVKNEHGLANNSKKSQNGFHRRLQVGVADFSGKSKNG
uniref:Secreted protein n=1 Tax=Oryza nivara TaxID=4536 RepID=A0A0E0FK40_ORYNI